MLQQRWSFQILKTEILSQALQTLCPGAEFCLCDIVSTALWVQPGILALKRNIAHASVKSTFEVMVLLPTRTDRVCFENMFDSRG